MRRRTLSYGLLALAATATMGAVAVHRLLDRPGESAFALVPANALGVASIDLVPAPDQVLAFKHIDETLAAANGGKLDTGSLLANVFSEPWMKPVVQQVDRSVALAVLPDPAKKDDTGFVGFVALKDPVALQDSLKAKGKPEKADGTTVYWLMNGKEKEMAVMVLDGYAVVSDKAWPLAAVGRVARNQAPSLASDPAFLSARERALTSSNLLVLVSPGTIKNNDWFVGSVAIRETGTETAISGMTDDPQILKGGSIKPLGSAVLDALPRGAYGFFATAQPGPAVALAGEALDEPSKEMKEEIEMDLRADVLPAFGGNLVLGFYPGYGPDAGLDLLVSIDDANGADPAKLARKLEAAIDEKVEKDDKAAEWKTDLPLEGAKASRLSDEAATEVQKGAREMEKSFFRPLTISKDKTVTWATVGNSVLFATSEGLLKRAVAARQNPSPALGLSGDVALGANPAAAADGQFAMAISLKRLVEGIRNTVDPSHMDPESAKMYRKVLSLYDATTEPMAIRANIEPSGRYRAYVSMPIDWSKLPQFVK